MFSIQVDSTQDIGASDQAAIFIRYIFNGEVKERLFALLKVTDSSGQGYYEMLKTLFIQHNISFKNLLKYNCLIMMHKIIYLKNTEYRFNKIIFAQSPRGKNLRSQKYKYPMYTRQFFNYTTCLWNDLPSYIQVQSNALLFKKELLKLF